jgi:hypothetical protein
MAGGAMKVYRALVEKIAAAGLPVVTELRPEETHGDGGTHVSRSWPG